MLRKIYKFVIVEVIYNGHLQALSAGSVVVIASKLLLNYKFDLSFFLLIYLVFQFIFYYDRYKDIIYDAITNPERTSHIKLYSRKMPIILLSILLLVILGFLKYSNITSLIASLIIMFLGVLYNTYFKKLTKIISLFKNFYVSSVYSLLVLFPYIYYHVEVSNLVTALIVLLLVFFGSLVNQIVLDSKDRKSDKKIGLKTLPVILGNEKSLKFMMQFTLTMSLFFLFVFLLLKSTPFLLILLIMNLIYDLVMINLVISGNRIGYFLGASKFLSWFVVLSLLSVLV